MSFTTDNQHPDGAKPDQQLIHFAKEFLRINRELGNYASDASPDMNAPDDLVDAQSDIIENASMIEATAIHGILAKMSIWAADAPDLSPSDGLSRYDAILMSAFSDLVKLCDTRIE
ncbi:MAG: hypothetical protein AAF557_18255 [Pseudomonadota bacterium]